ncbi:ATP-binding protein [Saccharopolyspora pogona]|uniref:ATP/GTP-binding protein n=1 Tax=Saccharopolyspora pogona TaxID=333966 RepID=UPI0016879AD7|nr:ATP/GTP-binding protein [Saccharopolyspora pogona]
MTTTPGPVLTRTGYRGHRLGRASFVDSPVEYRGTSVQVCGLWPWAVGAGSPTIGTPIGVHQDTGASVCFDPVAWFSRARLLSTPIVYVLGRPGLGKSTLVRRMVIGTAAQGVVPLILGDLRPDYAELVRQLGGQVVRLGRGLGSLNPLDVGALGSIIPRLSDGAATQVRSEIHGRRLHMVASLIELIRRTPISDHEETILSAALRILDTAHEGKDAPLLSDLIHVLETGPAELRHYTLDRGEDQRYRAAVDPLHRSLLALLEGPLGDTFSRPTSVRIDVDAPAVCIDISGLAVHDHRLTAAVLLSCWSDGFGAIEASNRLTDEGLAPQKRFFVVMDELWRVLRHGLVDRLDEMTRINREWATAVAYITHSFSLDSDAISNEADRAKAKGFIERSGAVISFGLPQREVDDLNKVVQHSEEERRRLTEWSTPGAWDHDLSEETPPPGQGHCLIKVGQRPGIPVQVQLTQTELDSGVHNTNRRWQ